MNERTKRLIVDQLTVRVPGAACPLCGFTKLCLRDALTVLPVSDGVHLGPRRTMPAVMLMCRRCFNTMLFPVRSFDLDEETKRDLGWPDEGGDDDVPR